jgi:hypothetical protein
LCLSPQSIIKVVILKCEFLIKIFLLTLPIMTSSKQRPLFTGPKGGHYTQV